MTRITIWRWLTRNVPEGRILPSWLIACHAVMFPGRSLLWWLQRNCGFDLLSGCWTIHGVRFSDQVFMAMSRPRPGVLYRFDRKPGAPLVTVTEIPAREVQP